MANLTGVRTSPTLIQAYGLREIAAGVAILSSSRPVGGMWARVAGDGLDLGTLIANLADADEERRQRILASIAAVVGVTIGDVAGALQLSAAAALEG